MGVSAWGLTPFSLHSRCLVGLQVQPAPVPPQEPDRRLPVKITPTAMAKTRIPKAARVSRNVVTGASMLLWGVNRQGSLASDDRRDADETDGEHQA